MYGPGHQRRQEILESGPVRKAMQDEKQFPDEGLFLNMRRVNVARGGKVVLKDLNLQIATGEHLAILGPNGCGKSTLLQTLTCESYPVFHPETRMTVFGRERWDVQELRRHLGVVGSELPGGRTARTKGLDAVISGFFSSSTIWPSFEVTEEMRDSGMEALERLEAVHLRDRLVGHMSAGEARRVMIARALVHKPEMLLLDEPSNALDLGAQRELREILRGLACDSSGHHPTGIIIVTHLLADILPEIDRVIMMRDGRIAGDGTKRALLTTGKLEELFGVKVDLVERGGYWHSW